MLSERDGSFEHPKHMFKKMGKEINAILGAQTIRIWTNVTNFGMGILFSLHPSDHLYYMSVTLISF